MIYMPHWPKPLGFRPSDFSLDRVIEVLNRMGNPEKKMGHVIHVSGTNGKGSTISFIRSILQSSGIKVNTYTSPHLVNFNERIVLNGKMISNRELFSILEECRYASQGIPITFFEGTTVAAFVAFSRSDSDVTLIETGMGGRLDATNVVDSTITIITSVSLDHTEYLGATVEEIAREKAGIIKENVICVLAPQQHSTVIEVIQEYATKFNAPLFIGNFDWKCKGENDGMAFTNASFEKILFPLPGLLGQHQIENCGSAIFLCEILRDKFNYSIKRTDIARGIVDVCWPARLERIVKGNLVKNIPSNWKIFLDGAHNISGAESLMNWIKDSNLREVYIIIGMTKERDCGDFLKCFNSLIKGVYAVCVRSEPRSQTAEEIVKSANRLNIGAVACESVEDAILKIVSVGDHNLDTTILICGSLFLAGDVLS